MVPIFLVITRLVNQGTSQDLKMYVCKRHLVYAFLYMICLVRALHDFKYYRFFEVENIDIWRAISCFMNSIGVGLSIACLSEPYVW